MLVGIHVDKPQKLNQEVKAAFTQAKTDSLRDMKAFDKESANAVNVKTTGSHILSPQVSSDKEISDSEIEDELDIKLSDIKSATRRLERLNSRMIRLSRQNTEVAIITAKMAALLRRLKEG